MMSAVTVRAAGAALPDGCRPVSVRVATRLSQPAQCEVTLDDPAGQGLSLLGAALTVRVGGDQRDLFAGEVTGVDLVRAADGATSTRVVAYDVLHRLRKRQTLRCLVKLDAADLAETMGAQLGLRVEAGERGPRFERVVQHRQRDLELLTGTLGRVGLYVVVDGDALRVVSLEGHGEPVRLTYGRDLQRVEVSASLERAATRCEAIGWRPQRADLLVETVEQAREGRDIKLRPAPGGATLTLVDEAAGSGDELRAVAQGALDASAARTVVLDGVAAGDARLRAGRRVRVEGVAGQLDGTYVLTEAVSTVDGDGYRSAVTTRPPDRAAFSGATATATALTLGTVTAVGDPDGCGRVRVSLDAHGGLDIGWLALLVPGAGAGRGLVVMPDVGDPVLVALPHDAAGDAIVLGSLFGTTAAPDGGGVSGGSVRRWSMRTAGGQSIVVDDEHKTLRLQNDAGSYLELTPDLLRLHAETDLLLDAPGHGITVKARSVDFEQALIGGVG